MKPTILLSLIAAAGFSFIALIGNDAKISIVAGTAVFSSLATIACRLMEDTVEKNLR